MTLKILRSKSISRDTTYHGSTVKPVCNDYLYDKIYYLWLIQ